MGSRKTYIEKGEVSTFLLLWLIFRGGVHLLQILDNLLSCLEIEI